jgi:TfoX/Sxy family transcriptional regulator of competence genes
MMSQWTKVPKAHEELLERALEAVPDAEKRKMFGCPAWFLNGYMFVGAHQEDIILRLPESDREDLLDRGLAQLFAPVKGRVMREYIVISPAIRDSAPDLEKWLLRSRDYTLSLPPKPGKGG